MNNLGIPIIGLGERAENLEGSVLMHGKADDGTSQQNGRVVTMYMRPLKIRWGLFCVDACMVIRPC
ncbi:MAG: hypothetical protein WD668_00430 [Saccharospirillum sp.]